MNLTFETTPEQDAAIRAHHDLTAPETPIDDFVKQGIADRLNELVTWYNDQKTRNIVQAYKDATADERALVDVTLKLAARVRTP